MRWSVNNMSIYWLKNSCYWLLTVDVIDSEQQKPGERSYTFEVRVETSTLNTTRYSPVCFRWACRFWQAAPKPKHTTYFYKNTSSPARQEIFKHYDWKVVNPHRSWYCSKYHSTTSVCLDDNINSENPPQPVISAHIGVLFKAQASLCFRSSHLGSAHL